MSIYLGVPPYVSVSLNDWALYVTNAINNSLNGKTNNTGSVTLTTSTVSTTVILAEGRLGPDTQIHLSPTTSNAAAAIPTTWISSRNVSTGKFVLTHASNTQADRNFNFILVG